MLDDYNWTHFLLPFLTYGFQIIWKARDAELKVKQVLGETTIPSIIFLPSDLLLRRLDNGLLKSFVDFTKALELPSRYLLFQ
jgi:hypothetical protein